MRHVTEEDTLTTALLALEPGEATLLLARSVAPGTPLPVPYGAPVLLLRLPQVVSVTHGIHVPMDIGTHLAESPPFVLITVSVQDPLAEPYSATIALDLSSPRDRRILAALVTWAWCPLVIIGYTEEAPVPVFCSGTPKGGIALPAEAVTLLAEALDATGHLVAPAWRG